MNPFAPIRPPLSCSSSPPKTSRSHTTSLIAPTFLMNIPSSVSFSTPASTSTLLDADDVFPSEGSSSGTSWLHPTRHEYEVYAGNLRSISLTAVQNMFFLLRNASTSIVEIFGTQGTLLTLIQSGRLLLLKEPNSIATSNCLIVCGPQSLSLGLSDVGSTSLQGC